MSIDASLTDLKGVKSILFVRCDEVYQVRLIRNRIHWHFTVSLNSTVVAIRSYRL